MLCNRQRDYVKIILSVQKISISNVVNAILFEGECCFHPILHHIHHVTLSRDLVIINLLPQPPTQIVLINHLIHLIYCNYTCLDLRVQNLFPHSFFWSIHLESLLCPLDNCVSSQGGMH